MTRFHAGRWAHFVEPTSHLVDNGRLLLEEREEGHAAVTVRVMGLIDGCVVPCEWLREQGLQPYAAARAMSMFYFGQSDTPAATDCTRGLEGLEVRLAQECEGMKEPAIIAALLSAYARQGVIVGPPFERPGGT